MKIKLCLMLFGLLSFSTTAIYGTRVEPLPPNLIDITSPSGFISLKDNLNINTLKLFSHFTTQKFPTYCAVASAVVVLNSAGIIPPLDLEHPPFRYFNQDNFFNEEVNKVVTAKEVAKKGISLIKLTKIFELYGLKASVFFADQINVGSFRRILKDSISNQQFVIVNFSRKQLQQINGVHYSPVAAYDENSDRFLILDVARYKYPVYWVKTGDLWKGVNTLVSDGSYRGFIVISH